MSYTLMVIDLGTSSCRLSAVDSAGRTIDQRRIDTAPGRGERDSLDHVEWDGEELAQAILGAARVLIADTPVDDIAITNQRTTCLLWERTTSRVLGPVLGWADSRTLDLERKLRQEHPEHQAGYSVTKWRWLLDRADPDRRRCAAGEICAGTLDSWLAWMLSGGAIHRTDFTNAAHTGMLNLDSLEWDRAVARRVGVPIEILPEIVKSTGEHGRATALEPAPMIRVLVGDQQASLFGQECLAAGAGAITLGTVGAFDLVVGPVPPKIPRRIGYPTVALCDFGETSYALESSVQAAGSAISWLIRTGILTAPEEIDQMVDPLRRPGSCIFVSALEGLGAPDWKFDARAAFVGLSGADDRAELVRAVLDGIACALAEILDLVEDQSGTPITSLSVDGGLANSSAMMRILAATSGRVLIRPVDVEATTRGAVLLASRSRGQKIPDMDMRETFYPQGAYSADREAWKHAVGYVLDERKNRLRSGALTH